MNQLRDLYHLMRKGVSFRDAVFFADAAKAIVAVLAWLSALVLLHVLLLYTKPGRAFLVWVWGG